MIQRAARARRWLIYLIGFYLERHVLIGTVDKSFDVTEKLTK